MDDRVVVVGAAEGERLARIVHLSDTHGKTMQLRAGVPDGGDVLVHSGDLCGAAAEASLTDLLRETNEFFDSFPDIPVSHRIFVAGNHELALCAEGLDRAAVQALLPSCTYLQDSGCEVAGLRFWGSPWTFTRTAFGLLDRAELDRKWALIPADTDVLVTHQPPTVGGLDLAFVDGAECGGECGGAHPGQAHWGCPALWRQVSERVRPRLHLFGHVHDASGAVEAGGVTYVNSAMDVRPQASVVDLYSS